MTGITCTGDPNCDADCEPRHGHALWCSASASRCTGDPDRPAHTCLHGPLCGAWPDENSYDPISYEAGYGQAGYEGCEHGSCLAMVNEHCEGCQYAAWLAMEEADWLEQQ